MIESKAVLNQAHCRRYIHFYQLGTSNLYPKFCSLEDVFILGVKKAGGDSPVSSPVTVNEAQI